MMHNILLLLQSFSLLSILAVGGGNAVIPDMQHIVVDQQHWLTAKEFVDLFAITRATPGPGSTIALMIGQHVAGLPGAVAGGLAMYVPSSLLVFICARIWRQTQKSAVVMTLERALTPIGIGLIFSSAVVLVQSTEHDALSWAITLASSCLLTFTEFNPLLILAAGAFLTSCAAWF